MACMSPHSRLRLPGAFSCGCKEAVPHNVGLRVIVIWRRQGLAAARITRQSARSLCRVDDVQPSLLTTNSGLLSSLTPAASTAYCKQMTRPPLSNATSVATSPPAEPTQERV